MNWVRLSVRESCTGGLGGAYTPHFHSGFRAE